jgi:hypothetical protein
MPSSVTTSKWLQAPYNFAYFLIADSVKDTCVCGDQTIFGNYGSHFTSGMITKFNNQALKKSEKMISLRIACTIFGRGFELMGGQSGSHVDRLLIAEIVQPALSFTFYHVVILLKYKMWWEKKNLQWAGCAFDKFKY